MITAQNIEKAYLQDSQLIPLLKNISLKVESGEFISIMGASGSGKSSLLYALSGIDKVDKGSVVFDGRELSAMTADELADLRRIEMGFVFQKPTLLSNINLLDNVILPQLVRSKEKAEDVKSQAHSLFKQVGLEGFEDRRINQVSGGQLQRVEIIRALMGNTKVIFADEPTGALNSQSAKEIMEIFKQIHQEGKTIVMVTHDPMIASYSDRVLLMKDGELIQEVKMDTSTSVDELYRILSENNI